MKRILVAVALFLGVSGLALAQSQTTQALATRFDGAMSLYFYKNTLRMLNQTDDKEFDELIKNIEKLKFMMIDKGSDGFTAGDYKKLVGDYKKESYEEIMTSRFEGRNFDVYLKESGGKTKGMIVLANDATSLFVLDLLGSVDINKVPQLFKQINESSDIGKMIKAFGDDHGKKSDDDDDN